MPTLGQSRVKPSDRLRRPAAAVSQTIATIRSAMFHIEAVPDRRRWSTPAAGVRPVETRGIDRDVSGAVSAYRDGEATFSYRTNLILPGSASPASRAAACPFKADPSASPGWCAPKR
jgi:hypothetical protein